jgi:hypothetical protein
MSTEKKAIRVKDAFQVVHEIVEVDSNSSPLLSEIHALSPL